MALAVAPDAWKPTEKQAEFIACKDYETLYGGAAGGGKTEGMLIDALGLNQAWGPAIKHPRYLAGIFRATNPELAEVIFRSKALYPGIVPGCEFYESDREWRFPSGARLKFGFMDKPGDEQRYKGAEYTYLGFEELTQFPSDVGYVYLLSRNRGVPELEKYVRATSNPDGPGHEWVKQRWCIGPDGAPTRFRVKTGDTYVYRRFMPAKIQDNAHNDPTYADRLHLLPEQTRNALLYGRWDVPDIRGSIFKPQIQAAYAQNRITSLPIETSVPVNCFWDLGNGDGCGIWFHQKIGFQNRFVDYYEAEGQGLEHYAGVIKAKGYVVENHYLPHDAVQKKLGIGEDQSVEQLFRKLRMTPTIVVPRVQSIGTGIEKARQVFASCWFDKDRCQKGIAALSEYHFKYDTKTQSYSTQPAHTWAARASDAFRQFAQGYRDLNAPNVFIVPEGKRLYELQEQKRAADPFNPRTDWMV